jgi:hypothetical protein
MAKNVAKSGENVSTMAENVLAMPESSSEANLEYQYQRFLKALGRNELDWDLDTRHWLRTMFYGAFATSISIIRQKMIMGEDPFDLVWQLETQAFLFFEDKLTPKN